MTAPENIPSAQIGHVLFVDIVRYSQGSLSTQRTQLENLKAAMEASPTYAAAQSAGSVTVLPTGDGMGLVFFNDVAAPAQCAVEITRSLGDSLPVRMGIHSGLAQKQNDLAGREGMLGEGINTAQRVMDVGDTGHILLSAQYALWLKQFHEWTSIVHKLGEALVKHGITLEVYSLHGRDFGNADRPARLRTATAPQAGQEKSRVCLLYKPTLDPDERVLHTVEERLRAAGCEVFVDSHQKITAAWARAIEAPIRGSDAVIAIVSPRGMQSEMLQFELETAHDQNVQTGKPAILPVVIGDHGNDEGAIWSLIGPLRRFHWSGPEDDHKLIAELLSAISEPIRPRVEDVKLEPVGGAVRPDSPFYVRRESDDELLGALEAGESILLVKGARQVGKTSLLGQAAKRAKELGYRFGITDFQKFNAAQIASDETFYRLLAATLSRQLGFHYDFELEWDPIFGANLNMEGFLRALLDSAEEHLVWCMDEVDKLFTARFAGDFFGLVRSWHNSRSTEPDGPWNKLTVVIAYATEAHLFIQDMNQSPFNVGRRLELQDFNIQQSIDLNGRYGSPLQSHLEIQSLYALIGGHPYLTRRALDALATGKYNLASLMEEAVEDEGPFGDHLKRLLVAVSSLPEVTEYAQAMIAGTAAPGSEAYYRLRAAGVARQDREGRIVFRCELYRRYLAGRLL